MEQSKIDIALRSFMDQLSQAKACPLHMLEITSNVVAEASKELSNIFKQPIIVVPYKDEEADSKKLFANKINLMAYPLTIPK